jgi:hypothetical protein
MDLRAHRRALAGVARGTVSGVAVFVCVGLLAACGSSGDASTTKHAGKTYLNVAHVERAIERSIKSQRHLESRVVCPTKVLQKPGKFPCIATTFAHGKPHKQIKTPFVVTIHNTKGYVTYIGR